MNFRRVLMVGLLFVLARLSNVQSMMYDGQKTIGPDLCFLDFPSDVELDRSEYVTWGLSKNFGKLSLTYFGEKQESLATALNLFYLHLNDNFFDVRPLEDVMLGIFKGCYYVTPQDNNFVTSELTITGLEADPKATYTLRLPRLLTARSNNSEVEQHVRLSVMSNILPLLAGDALIKYRAELIHLSNGLLNPFCSKDTHRVFNLDFFRLGVIDLGKEYNLMPVVPILEEASKDESIKEAKITLYKNNSFHNILTGLSFGLNLGFTLKYFLHEYLQENPRLTMPLIGLSTLLGGLSGYCCTPWLFRRK